MTKADIMDRIRAALHEANLTHTSNDTSLTVQQVRNIRDGVSKDPRLSTVRALAKYLELPFEVPDRPKRTKARK